MYLNYDGCQHVLGGRETKKLSNNTYLRKEGANYIVKLHNTDIITVTPDNKLILNSGGWQTPTTKARINEFTKARISQKRGIWYLAAGSTPFYDGIVIDSEGQPVDNDGNNPGTEAVEKRRFLDKEVSAYIKGYVKWALKNGVETGNGDCWLCLFGAPTDLYHVSEHVKERYYFGSFLKTAIKGSGRAMIWYDMIRIDLQNGKTDSLRDILVSYFKKVKPKMLDYVELPEQTFV
jgi:hypothetical protein